MQPHMAREQKADEEGVSTRLGGCSGGAACSRMCWCMPRGAMLGSTLRKGCCSRRQALARCLESLHWQSQRLSMCARTCEHSFVELCLSCGCCCGKRASSVDLHMSGEVLPEGRSLRMHVVQRTIKIF